MASHRSSSAGTDEEAASNNTILVSNETETDIFANETAPRYVLTSRPLSSHDDSGVTATERTAQRTDDNADNDANSPDGTVDAATDVDSRTVVTRKTVPHISLHGSEASHGRVKSGSEGGDSRPGFDASSHGSLLSDILIERNSVPRVKPWQILPGNLAAPGRLKTGRDFRRKPVISKENPVMKPGGVTTVLKKLESAERSADGEQESRDAPLEARPHTKALNPARFDPGLATAPRDDTNSSRDTSDVYTYVTFRKGVGAGVFTKQHHVHRLEDCVDSCSRRPSCHVAYMVEKTCYSIQCHSQKTCEILPVHTAEVATRAVYMKERLLGLPYNSESIQASPADPSKGNERLQSRECARAKFTILRNVTLQDGLRAGNFTDYGQVTAAESCARICCGLGSCDAAFMIASNCFAVQCASQRACGAVPSRVDRISTSLVYFHRMSNTKNNEKATAGETTRSHGESYARRSETCAQRGGIRHGVTFSGGFKAGTFTPQPGVTDIKACVERCCGSAHCDAAFMLDSGCYSVRCVADRKLCRVIMAGTDKFQTSVAFVSRTAAAQARKPPTAHKARKMKHSILNGQCEISGVRRNVNLTGSWQAGKFVRYRDINDIHRCSEICCRYHGCSSALIIGQHCYNLLCFRDNLCRQQATNGSFMIPKMVVVQRKSQQAGSMLPDFLAAALSGPEEFVTPRIPPNESFKKPNSTEVPAILSRSFNSTPVAVGEEHTPRISDSLSTITQKITPHGSSTNHSQSSQASPAIVSSQGSASHSEPFLAASAPVGAVQTNASREIHILLKVTEKLPAHGLPTSLSVSSETPLLLPRPFPLNNNSSVHKMEAFVHSSSSPLQRKQAAVPTAPFLFSREIFVKLRADTPISSSGLVDSAHASNPKPLSLPSQKHERLSTTQHVTMTVTADATTAIRTLDETPRQSHAAPIQSTLTPTVPAKRTTETVVSANTIPNVHSESSFLGSRVASSSGKRANAHSPKLGSIPGDSELTSSGAARAQDPALQMRGHSTPGRTCRRSPPLHNVGFRSGLRAGTFKSVGVVDDSETCVRRCCAAPDCSAALLLGSGCYLVSCFSQRTCQAVEARTSSFAPTLVYIVRSEKEAQSLSEFLPKSIVRKFGLSAMSFTNASSAPGSRDETAGQRTDVESPVKTRVLPNSVESKSTNEVALEMAPSSKSPTSPTARTSQKQTWEAGPLVRKAYASGTGASLSSGKKQSVGSDQVISENVKLGSSAKGLAASASVSIGTRRKLKGSILLRSRMPITRPVNRSSFEVHSSVVKIRASKAHTHAAVQTARVQAALLPRATTTRANPSQTSIISVRLSRKVAHTAANAVHVASQVVHRSSKMEKTAGAPSLSLPPRPGRTKSSSTHATRKLNTETAPESSPASSAVSSSYSPSVGLTDNSAISSDIRNIGQTARTARLSGRATPALPQPAVLPRLGSPSVTLVISPSPARPAKSVHVSGSMAQSASKISYSSFHTSLRSPSKSSSSRSTVVSSGLYEGQSASSSLGRDQSRPASILRNGGNERARPSVGDSAAEVSDAGASTSTLADREGKLHAALTSHQAQSGKNTLKDAAHRSRDGAGERGTNIASSGSLKHGQGSQYPQRVKATGPGSGVDGPRDQKEDSTVRRKESPTYDQPSSPTRASQGYLSGVQRTPEPKHLTSVTDEQGQKRNSISRKAEEKPEQRGQRVGAPHKGGTEDGAAAGNDQHGKKRVFINHKIDSVLHGLAASPRRKPQGRNDQHKSKAEAAVSAARGDREGKRVAVVNKIALGPQPLTEARTPVVKRVGSGPSLAVTGMKVLAQELRRVHWTKNQTSLQKAERLMGILQSYVTNATKRGAIPRPREAGPRRSKLKSREDTEIARRVGEIMSALIKNFAGVPFMRKLNSTIHTLVKSGDRGTADFHAVKSMLNTVAVLLRKSRRHLVRTYAKKRVSVKDSSSGSSDELFGSGVSDVNHGARVNKTDGASTLEITAGSGEHGTAGSAHLNPISARPRVPLEPIFALTEPVTNGSKKDSLALDGESVPADAHQGAATFSTSISPTEGGTTIHLLTTPSSNAADPSIHPTPSKNPSPPDYADISRYINSLFHDNFNSPAKDKGGKYSEKTATPALSAIPDEAGVPPVGMSSPVDTLSRAKDVRHDSVELSELASSVLVAIKPSAARQVTAFTPPPRSAVAPDSGGLSRMFARLWDKFKALLTKETKSASQPPSRVRTSQVHGEISAGASRTSTPTSVIGVPSSSTAASTNIPRSVTLDNNIHRSSHYGLKTKALSSTPLKSTVAPHRVSFTAPQKPYSTAVAVSLKSPPAQRVDLAEGVQPAVIRVPGQYELNLCSHSDPHENSTLRGGIHAGRFTEAGAVSRDAECISRCCEADTCDVAFMLLGHCFLVQCRSKKLCESVPAKDVADKPRVVYVQKALISPERSPSTGLASSSVKIQPSYQPSVSKNHASTSVAASEVHRIIPPQPKPKLTIKNFDVAVSPFCNRTHVRQGVDLRGGFKSGFFKHQGELEDWDSCVELCCMWQFCSLAYAVKNQCYSVACYSDDLCESVPAQNSSLKLAYIRSSTNSFHEAQKKASTGIPRTTTENVAIGSPSQRSSPAPPASALSEKNPSLEEQSSCHGGEHESGMTLRGGINAGWFLNAGSVSDVGHCVSKCCHRSDCHVAFVVSSHCFLVKCFRPELCRSVPARKSKYKTTLVRISRGGKADDVENVLANAIRPSSASGRAENVPFTANNQTGAGGRPRHRATFPHPSSRIKGNHTAAATRSNIERISDAQSPGAQAGVSMETAQLAPARPVQNNSVESLFGNNDENKQHRTWLIKALGMSTLTNQGSRNAFSVRVTPSARTATESVRPARGGAADKEKKEKKESAPPGEVCYGTRVYASSTMRGGIKAGIIKEAGPVDDMKACVSRCCQWKFCTVAFMILTRCYMIACYDEHLCEPIPARDVAFSPRLEFVSRIRRGDEEVISNSRPSVKSPPIRSPAQSFTAAERHPRPTRPPNQTSLATPVSKKKTHSRKSPPIRNPVQPFTGPKRDPRPTGPPNQTSSATPVPKKEAHPRKSLPIRNPAQPFTGAKENPRPTRPPNRTSSATPVPKKEAHPRKSQSSCSEGSPEMNVTLRGGLKSGNFTDRGKVGDIGRCARLCCAERQCDVALMLLENCFLVKCWSRRLCESVPARTSVYRPRLVRMYASDKSLLDTALPAMAEKTLHKQPQRGERQTPQPVQPTRSGKSVQVVITRSEIPPIHGGKASHSPRIVNETRRSHVSGEFSQAPSLGAKTKTAAAGISPAGKFALTAPPSDSTPKSYTAKDLDRVPTVKPGFSPKKKGKESSSTDGHTGHKVEAQRRRTNSAAETERAGSGSKVLRLDKDGGSVEANAKIPPDGTQRKNAERRHPAGWASGQDREGGSGISSEEDSLRSWRDGSGHKKGAKERYAPKQHEHVTHTDDQAPDRGGESTSGLSPKGQTVARTAKGSTQHQTIHVAPTADSSAQEGGSVSGQSGEQETVAMTPKGHTPHQTVHGTPPADSSAQEGGSVSGQSGEQETVAMTPKGHTPHQTVHGTPPADSSAQEGGSVSGQSGEQETVAMTSKGHTPHQTVHGTPPADSSAQEGSSVSGQSGEQETVAMTPKGHTPHQTVNGTPPADSSAQGGGSVSGLSPTEASAHDAGSSPGASWSGRGSTQELASGSAARSGSSSGHTPSADPVGAAQRAQSRLSSCYGGPISYNVTLKDGFRSGSFQNRGRVDDMGECVRLCCAAHACDVAFMLRETCYSVRCYTESGCQAVRSRRSSYSPRLVKVRRQDSQLMSFIGEQGMEGVHPGPVTSAQAPRAHVPTKPLRTAGRSTAGPRPTRPPTNRRSRSSAHRGTAEYLPTRQVEVASTSASLGGDPRVGPAQMPRQGRLNKSQDKQKSRQGQLNGGNGYSSDLSASAEDESEPADSPMHRSSAFHAVRENEADEIKLSADALQKLMKLWKAKSMPVTPRPLSQGSASRGGSHEQEHSGFVIGEENHETRSGNGQTSSGAKWFDSSALQGAVPRFSIPKPTERGGAAPHGPQRRPTHVSNRGHHGAWPAEYPHTDGSSNDGEETPEKQSVFPDFSDNAQLNEMVRRFLQAHARKALGKSNGHRVTHHKTHHRAHHRSHHRTHHKRRGKSEDRADTSSASGEQRLIPESEISSEVKTMVQRFLDAHETTGSGQKDSQGVASDNAYKRRHSKSEAHENREKSDKYPRRRKGKHLRKKTQRRRKSNRHDNSPHSGHGAGRLARLPGEQRLLHNTDLSPQLQNMIQRFLDAHTVKPATPTRPLSARSGNNGHARIHAGSGHGSIAGEGEVSGVGSGDSGGVSSPKASIDREVPHSSAKGQGSKQLTQAWGRNLPTDKASTKSKPVRPTTTSGLPAPVKPTRPPAFLTEPSAPTAKPTAKSGGPVQPTKPPGPTKLAKPPPSPRRSKPSGSSPVVPACTAGPPEFNQTLRGGLSSGLFHEVGHVTDVQTCAVRCCASPICDLAFMVLSHCFLVTCSNSNPRLCDSVPALATNFKPVISRVTRPRSHERGGVLPVKPTTRGSTGGHVSKTTARILPATPLTTPKPVRVETQTTAAHTSKHLRVANRSSSTTPKPTARRLSTPGGRTTKLRTQAAQPPTPKPHEATTNRTQRVVAKAGTPPPTQAPARPILPEPGCASVSLRRNSTIRGGLHAGKFMDMGVQDSVPGCARLCCNSTDCDAALYTFGRCYVVKCYDPYLCQTVPSRLPDFQPTVIQISRSRQPAPAPVTVGEVLHSIQDKSGSQGEESCPHSSLYTDVTLRKGYQAGTFTSHGQVGSPEECISHCCREQHCDLMFMFLDKCFTVSCYSGYACEIVAAKRSRFTPKIMYVVRKNTSLSPPSAAQLNTSLFSPSAVSGYGPVNAVRFSEDQAPLGSGSGSAHLPKSARPKYGAEHAQKVSLIGSDILAAIHSYLNSMKSGGRKPTLKGDQRYLRLKHKLRRLLKGLERPKHNQKGHVKKKHWTLKSYMTKEMRGIMKQLHDVTKEDKELRSQVKSLVMGQEHRTRKRKEFHGRNARGKNSSAAGKRVVIVDPDTDSVPLLPTDEHRMEEHKIYGKKTPRHKPEETKVTGFASGERQFHSPKEHAKHKHRHRPPPTNEHYIEEHDKAKLETSEHDVHEHSIERPPVRRVGHSHAESAKEDARQKAISLHASSQHSGGFSDQVAESATGYPFGSGEVEEARDRHQEKSIERKIGHQATRRPKHRKKHKSRKVEHARHEKSKLDLLLARINKIYERVEKLGHPMKNVTLARTRLKEKGKRRKPHGDESGAGSAGHSDGSGRNKPLDHSSRHLNSSAHGTGKESAGEDSVKSYKAHLFDYIDQIYHHVQRIHQTKAQRRKKARKRKETIDELASGQLDEEGSTNAGGDEKGMTERVHKGLENDEEGDGTTGGSRHEKHARKRKNWKKNERGPLHREKGTKTGKKLVRPVSGLADHHESAQARKREKGRKRRKGRKDRAHRRQGQRASSDREGSTPAVSRKTKEENPRKLSEEEIILREIEKISNEIHNISTKKSPKSGKEPPGPGNEQKLAGSRKALNSSLTEADAGQRSVIPRYQSVAAASTSGGTALSARPPPGSETGPGNDVAIKGRNMAPALPAGKYKQNASTTCCVDLTKPRSVPVGLSR